MSYLHLSPFVRMLTFIKILWQSVFRSSSSAISLMSSMNSSFSSSCLKADLFLFSVDFLRRGESRFRKLLVPDMLKDFRMDWNTPFSVNFIDTSGQELTSCGLPSPCLWRELACLDSHWSIISGVAFDTKMSVATSWLASRYFSTSSLETWFRAVAIANMFFLWLWTQKEFIRHFNRPRDDTSQVFPFSILVWSHLVLVQDLKI